MAPERFSGSWRIGPAADVFSLGIIGVQLLTGYLPTIDPSGDELRNVNLITSGRYVDRAKTQMATCGGRLASLILKMIDPNPDRRPTDYPSLIGGLEAL